MMWSNFGDEQTSLAAEFIPDWSAVSWTCWVYTVNKTWTNIIKQTTHNIT